MAEHEQRDINVRLSASVLAGLLVLVVLVLAAIRGGLALLGGPPPTPPDRLPIQATSFPAPALRIDPLDEPAALAREKAPRLHDVDAAMRRLEASGWPPEKEGR